MYGHAGESVRVIASLPQEVWDVHSESALFLRWQLNTQGYLHTTIPPAARFGRIGWMVRHAGAYSRKHRHSFPEQEILHFEGPAVREAFVHDFLTRAVREAPQRHSHQLTFFLQKSCKSPNDQQFFVVRGTDAIVSDHKIVKNERLVATLNLRF